VTSQRKRDACRTLASTVSVVDRREGGALSRRCAHPEPEASEKRVFVAPEPALRRQLAEVFGIASAQYSQSLVISITPSVISENGRSARLDGISVPCHPENCGSAPAMAQAGGDGERRTGREQRP
jgi:hypothetical protein